MLKQYFDILAVHLNGKEWKKYYRQIVFHLDCVNRGYKPSILWDIGPQLDTNTLERIIHDLKNASILCSYICLVLIEDEKFVLNLITICKNFETYLKFLKLVDCSSEHDCPILMKYDSYEEVMLMINFIKDKLFNVYKLHKSCQDMPVINLEIDVIQCPPTAFGVLLGFPVVYWFSDITRGNCLSNIPLDVYKIKICNSLQSQFKPNLDLYSFSSPACLNLSKYVTDWIIRLKEVTDVEFQLSQTVETYTFVQL